MLELIGICKNYKINRQHDFCALKDINLKFKDNSFNVIIGESGSGKTTLLNIIAGFDDKTLGKILFNGEEITAKRQEGYRNTAIGYVSQRLDVIEDFSLKDNLAVAFELANKKFDLVEAETLLASMGLPEEGISIDEFLNKRAVELSVGQLQRFIIAKALIKSPKILLLDEPTSALDEENSKALINLLKEMSKTTIVIVSTHEKNIFLDSADQIIKIQNRSAKVIKNDTRLVKGKNDYIDFKKGFISFFKTIEIAIKNLKYKKIFLITSMLLTVIAGTLFGSAFMLDTYDKNSTLLRTQLDNNQQYTFLRYYHKHRIRQYSSIWETDVIPLKDYQLKKLDEYTSNEYVTAYHMYDLNFYDTINFTDTIGEYGYISYYIGEINCAMEVDQQKGEEQAQIHRCQKLRDKTECRLPETMNEVAINSLMAYAMLVYGFVEEINPENNTIVSVYKPNAIDDLIGKKLYNGLTITGIYSSNDGMCEYFEPYLKGYPDDMSSDEIELINRYRNGRSPANFIYVKKGYSNTHETTTSNKPSYYFLKLKGDYYSDKNFIDSFKINNGFGGEYYARIYNNYSGFFNLVDSFSSYFAIVSWISIIILLIVSFIIVLNFFYSNVKMMEKNLGTLKAAGASNLSILFIILCQSLMISLTEWAFSLIAIQIISLVINAKVGITLFALTPSMILALLAIIVAPAVIVSILSTRKVILSKPVRTIQNN